MKRDILPTEYNVMGDHDLLVALCIKHDVLDKSFCNHLKHHFIVTTIALSAALSGIASFIVGLLLLLAKFRVG